jgi:hypothetical protein
MPSASSVRPSCCSDRYARTGMVTEVQCTASRTVLVTVGYSSVSRVRATLRKVDLMRRKDDFGFLGAFTLPAVNLLSEILTFLTRGPAPMSVLTPL